ncbi:2-phospho-L-lactate guanylyltransferase [Halomicrobium salinisoli]|uniref:2-phospho-L-lactate guanylyltransferase n=1 Tax=Halomicrobium salinisoli TaxID=2878391 RepID=UPI001CF00B7B|nr:2-phospho-L-lactate guanylyltransferase [Halomicrobium salinisoli]
MRVVVPFDATEPKTRLSSVLSADERREFAAVLLGDVLNAIAAADVETDVEVVATDDVDCDAPVTVDDRPLDPAINDRLDAGPLAVVMADLAIATPAAIERLFAPDDDVVLVPGLGGGTNAFVARTDAFRVDYHDASIRDHRENARAVGSVAEVDSFRLAVDVDEPGDLAEVLLHGAGEAPEWLRERGFAVATDGRTGVERGED